MTDGHPAVFTIPSHRAFADALVHGLVVRFQRNQGDLAKGIVLVPNNRAARAIQDAFVRRSGSGLLLPRLLPVGDPELDERIGGMLEQIDDVVAVPPAIEPVDRLMLLARLVQRRLSVDAAEAIRLAQDLLRTLDQLLIEEVDPARLATFAQDLPDLSAHWQKSLDQLQLILTDWPALLAAEGRIDLADRRNRLLAAAANRWRQRPPSGFVCAAGVTTSAPAIARLLQTVSWLGNGLVVLPGLDLDMSESEWEALGSHQAEGVGHRRSSTETHPQFHLKVLLDRMGIGRREVQSWRWSGTQHFTGDGAGPRRNAPAARSRAIAHALAPAAFTRKWQMLAARERRLTGVRALELADPAEEAQAIAIALREILEKPGQTAALVTPDRGLARRVSVHLRRWGIAADDSAGRPLSETPSGTLLLALATAAAERFAPVPLLALLKHPLVAAGEGRLRWLDGTRLLDLVLRGPRPASGLAGITQHLSDRSGRDRELRAEASNWWRVAQARLEALESAFEETANLADLLAAIRSAAVDLSGDGPWVGPAGREAADLFTALESAATKGPEQIKPSELPALLEGIMAAVAVRPPYGQHPRIFIWGLLEGRLQHADLMILGGLNEGVWPPLPAPDPWLAPRLRSHLGLPSLERRIGLTAHDFGTFLGARQVLVTRARRDSRSPAIASRFWLRMEAMTGGVTRTPQLRKWAQALDRPAEHKPARRPAPRPAERPRKISVTEVDRLKADPYAFYARRILGLSVLDPVDADPTAAWRGTAVHAVLEAWMNEDNCDPAKLRKRFESLLAGADAHPLMRALWQPRLLEAIEFIAAQVEKNRANGRLPLRAEAWGMIKIAGVELGGKADRIDLCGDGRLAIVDYKTGQPPSGKAVAGGFSLQLGLLGLIAEHGGFDGIEGTASCFEYWSLARKAGKLGFVASAVGGRNGLQLGDFTMKAAANFGEAAGQWLTGGEPFVAKLHPEFAPYRDYDQLMRLDEWYGRE